MFSACQDCSKGTLGWAQPTADGLWRGGRAGAGTDLLQQQAEPHCHSPSWVHWVEDEDSHGQVEEGSELDPAQLQGRRQQACRGQNEASHSWHQWPNTAQGASQLSHKPQHGCWESPSQRSVHWHSGTSQEDTI